MKIRDNVKPSLPPLPGGSYLGICVYSIAIGEQLCEYEGKSKSYNNQVLLGFEICGQTIEIDGKPEPRVLSKTFNVAKSKRSGLRIFINSWEARELSDDEFLEVDTNNYVGKPAMLTVVLNDTGEYSNIGNIAPLPQGLPITIPEPMSELIRFDMEPWNQAAYDALPEWAQNRIQKSSEWQKSHVPQQDVTVQGGQQPPAIDFAQALANMQNQPATVNPPTPNGGLPF